jgi:hypothetical protein
MDKVRKPNVSVCYTPSSEPYSIYEIPRWSGGSHSCDHEEQHPIDYLVMPCVPVDVSEKHTSYNFRVSEYAKLAACRVNPESISHRVLVLTILKPKSLNFTILSLRGVPSDKGTSLSFVTVFVFVKCIHSHTFKWLLHIHTWPLTVQALYNRLCLIFLSLCHNGSLVTWTAEVWRLRSSSLLRSQHRV